MLLFNLDLLAQNPGLFVRLVAIMSAALVITITIHEASHALIATWQGDRTARALGRLSLNPLRHLDKTGTVFLFLVGFGWGRPVPVNPFWLRSGPKVGMAVVALAGPASNLLTAAVVALPVRLGILAWHAPFSYEPLARVDAGWILSDLVGFVVFYSLILAAFNLIPVAPLDGFKVAVGALPMRQAVSFSRLEPYGPGILVGILMLSYLPIINFGLWDVLGPVIQFFSGVFVGRPLL